MKRIVVLTLAGIGALSILLCGAAAIYVFALNGGSEYKVEKILEAPDHEHTATIYTGMGGGAAGWCTQIISITTPRQPFSLSTESHSVGFQVFRASCDATIHAHWRSPSQFQIGFSTNSDSDGVSVYMRRHDHSREVSIDYVMATQQGAPADRATASPSVGG